MPLQVWPWPDGIAGGRYALPTAGTARVPRSGLTHAVLAPEGTDCVVTLARWRSELAKQHAARAPSRFNRYCVYFVYTLYILYIYYILPAHMGNVDRRTSLQPDLLTGLAA